MKDAPLRPARPPAGEKMDERYVRPGGRHLDSGTGTSAPRSLPPELLGQVARRLELMSLGLAAAFAVALVLLHAVREAGWHPIPHLGLRDVIAGAMIVASATVAWLARGGRLEPTRLLRMGLAYEVVVAFGISMGDHLTPLSSEHTLYAVSWLCVWIVMFPLVVPAPPPSILLASVVAASTWPVAFFVGRALGNPAPPPAVVLLNALENYIAAAMALAPALIIRRLGRDVQKAREMGSYELVERLDRGGMGEVWRARHRMLARPAAIKLIRPEALGLGGGRLAETLVRRFEREAQATAALHSSHTIALYDFGITPEGTFYYVMELLEGLDLEGLVRRFGPLPAERAIHLLLQACDSLADAHDVGLVHRDIKPANLYLCRQGLRFDFVKVLDFGLVKSAWTETEPDERLTREGAVAGTPAYMAPETVLGNREIDPRVDLYALGGVAYWLVTGLTVFEKGTAAQMALHHLQTAPVPPSRRTERPVPESLERVILRCLEKDPDRRPSTALELASELAACPVPPWTQEDARRWWWEVYVPREGGPAAGSPGETAPSMGSSGAPSSPTRTRVGGG